MEKAIFRERQKKTQNRMFVSLNLQYSLFKSRVCVFGLGGR